MSAIGLDIGNESCVIAAAKRGGIDVLLNDESKRETPAVVSFGDKQRFLGSAAAAFATANPKSTITQIKRLIGRLYNEPSVQKDLQLLPFTTREGPRGGILIELDYLKKKWEFTPVEILGMFFTHLKQIAQKNLEPVVVSECVIGIPSYFTDLQRREYLDAASIAGLKPLRLIHDGTATALGYGMYKTDFSGSGPTNVVFVDIGHCDTQVTVAAFKQGEMKILSHCFDQSLGGRDFDEVLFNHFAAKFVEQYSIDVYSNPRASIRLRAACEKLKKVLSANAEAPLSIECLINDTDVRGVITREEFEKLSSELLERVTVPCKKAVKESGLRLDKIYTIELVGSGSRIPAIMKRLTSLFKKEPTRTLNASECVARGCALRCAMLSPSQSVRDYEIQDVYPYTIVADEGEKNRNQINFFPKGTKFPNVNSIRYDGIIPFFVHVFYTDKTDLPAGLSPKVGHFKIDTSKPSGEDKVKFSFSVKLNDDGIVEIESVTPSEDNSRQLKTAYHLSNLKATGNLDVATTEDELRKAKKKEKLLAEQDKKVEQTKDQRNTLESFVYDTRSKLSSAYKSFATETEKEVITKSLQDTEDWLYEDSDDESEQLYTGKLQDLKKLLDPVEIKYKNHKDEIAKVQAMKALQTCIDEYRLAAESMPPGFKEEVEKEITKVQNWLNDIYNHHSLPQNADGHTWSNVIKNNMEILKRRCDRIIKSPFPEHDENVFQDEREQSRMNPNQKEQSRVNPATQREQSRMNLKLNQSEQSRMNLISQRVQSRLNTNLRYQPRGASNQRDQHMNPNQSSQPSNPNHRNQHLNPNQSGQPTNPNQSGQPTNPNQSGQAANPYQSVQPANPYQSVQPANPYQSVQPANPYQSVPPANPYQSVQPANPYQSGQPANPNRSFQSGNRYQSVQPANPYQSDQPLNLNQSNNLLDPNKSDHLADLIQRDHLADLDQKAQLADFDLKAKLAEMELKAQSANLDQKAQSVHPDKRNVQAMDKQSDDMQIG